ncbi:MAG TPA: O-acetyl-ADP-ribose deacetylase [Chloroflexota bacterium]|nr:O-acetyl-ADP-ribose deacetylase [Chloroflexota bacterium]
MTETSIGAATLRLIQGDIARVAADAIVNAANSGLAGGGGVDGAIHRAGGPTIMAECRKIGRCPTGSAVLTGAGSLPAKFVIHAVAPVYHDGNHGEPDLLRGAYAASLALAEAHNLRTLAFPSLGTGAYGYPVSLAAAIALDIVATHLRSTTTLQEVTFVLFSASDLAVYEGALARLVGGAQ